MISPEKFISTWGADNLVRYDMKAVKALPISRDARRFLMDIGLPCWTDSALTFDVPPYDLPQVTEASRRNFPEPPQDPFDFPLKYNRYRILGVNGLDVRKTYAKSYGPVFAFVCIDVKSKGRVALLSFHGVWKPRFMNSNLFAMVEMLTLYRQYQQTLSQLEDCSQQQRIEIGRPIALAMRQADPPACEWPKPWAKTLIPIEGGISP